MNVWILIIPIVSAIIGGLALWIAGKLFVHRIILRRRQYIAENIAHAAGQAFSIAKIENNITSPESIQKVMPVVEEHVDDFLRNKLKQKMPMIGMLIGDKTISSLKEVFLGEIEELFPQVLKKFADNLQQELDIESEIIKKLNSLSPAEIEKTFLPALRYFVLAGAVSGLITGILNMLFLSI